MRKKWIGVVLAMAVLAMGALGGCKQEDGQAVEKSTLVEQHREETAGAEQILAWMEQGDGQASAPGVVAAAEAYDRKESGSMKNALAFAGSLSQIEQELGQSWVEQRKAAFWGGQTRQKQRNNSTEGKCPPGFSESRQKNLFSG